MDPSYRNQPVSFLLEISALVFYAIRTLAFNGLPNVAYANFINPIHTNVPFPEAAVGRCSAK